MKGLILQDLTCLDVLSFKTHRTARRHSLAHCKWTLGIPLRQYTNPANSQERHSRTEHNGPTGSNWHIQTTLSENAHLLRLTQNISTNHFWVIKHAPTNSKQWGGTEYALRTHAIKLETSNRKQLMRSHSVLGLISAVRSRKLVKGDVTREMLKYLGQTKVKNHLGLQQPLYSQKMGTPSPMLWVENGDTLFRDLVLNFALRDSRQRRQQHLLKGK